MGEEYVKPRNDIEQKLADIWSDVLKIDQDKIGIHDNFFHLGGNSLLAIQLVSRIETAGFEASLKSFFENSTIKKMSDHLSKKNKKEIKVIKPDQGVLTGEYELLPSHIILLDKQYVGRVFLKIDKLDFDKLCAIIPDLIFHHDILRATFINRQGVWKQKYNKKIDIPEIKKLDISSYENYDEVTRVTSNWCNDFDIEVGPLWRIAYLYGYEDNSARIFIGFHRLILDYQSCEILKKDIQSFYRGEKLPDKNYSFLNWVQFLKQSFEIRYDELRYWKYVQSRQEKVSSDLFFLNNTSCQQFSLSRKLSHNFLSKANKPYNTDGYELVLCALSYAMHDIYKNNNNYINLNYYNKREVVGSNISFKNTVGNFEYKFPLELKVLQDYRATIHYVIDALRGFSNDGLGYSYYGFKNNIKINFHNLGMIDDIGVLDAYKKQNHDISDGLNVSYFTYSLDNTINFIVSSRLKRYDQERFVSSFTSHLKGIINFCCKNHTKSFFIRDTKITYEIINESINSVPFIFIPPVRADVSFYHRFGGWLSSIKNKKILLLDSYIFMPSKKETKLDLDIVKYHEIVESYVRKIKQIFPNGPYSFFGFSLGGTLSYSVAKKFVNMGDKIDQLIFLDSFFTVNDLRFKGERIDKIKNHKKTGLGHVIFGARKVTIYKLYGSNIKTKLLISNKNKSILYYLRKLFHIQSYTRRIIALREIFLSESKLFNATEKYYQSFILDDIKIKYFKCGHNTLEINNHDELKKDIECELLE